MALNKDGFEPGQRVSFEDVMRFRGSAPKVADEAGEIPTLESIAAMKKAEVQEWLEAHGADTAGSVADLRDRLVSVMFVDFD